MFEIKVLKLLSAMRITNLQKIDAADFLRKSEKKRKKRTEQSINLSGIFNWLKAKKKAKIVWVLMGSIPIIKFGHAAI